MLTLCCMHMRFVQVAAICAERICTAQPIGSMRVIHGCGLQWPNTSHQRCVVKTRRRMMYPAVTSGSCRFMVALPHPPQDSFGERNPVHPAMPKARLQGEPRNPARSTRDLWGIESCAELSVVP
ncbi:hypothetical protein F4802DRAFT_394344 [Xylaria palmicola]|nr:hypothetical protein F4802DRAFT_394344 [Xylaria palmicola]